MTSQHIDSSIPLEETTAAPGVHTAPGDRRIPWPGPVSRGACSPPAQGGEACEPPQSPPAGPGPDVMAGKRRRLLLRSVESWYVQASIPRPALAWLIEVCTHGRVPANVVAECTDAELARIANWLQDVAEGVREVKPVPMPNGKDTWQMFIYGEPVPVVGWGNEKRRGSEPEDAA